MLPSSSARNSLKTNNIVRSLDPTRPAAAVRVGSPMSKGRKGANWASVAPDLPHLDPGRIP
eukprot:6744802-Lingulodinium_polyedra.AAC.1